METIHFELPHRTPHEGNRWPFLDCVIGINAGHAGTDYALVDRVLRFLLLGIFVYLERLCNIYRVLKGTRDLGLLLLTVRIAAKDSTNIKKSLKK